MDSNSIKLQLDECSPNLLCNNPTIKEIINVSAVQSPTKINQSDELKLEPQVINIKSITNNVISVMRTTTVFTIDKGVVLPVSSNNAANQFVGVAMGNNDMDVDRISESSPSPINTSFFNNLPPSDKQSKGSDSDATVAATKKEVVKRSSISLVDKERIINAYENGEDYYEFSRLLGVKKRTAKDIIFRYNKTGLVSVGKSGGHRKALITDEIGDKLLAFIDANYSATLAEMKEYLEKHHDISPSLVTISKFLRNKYITRKKLRYTMVGKNTDAVKEMRMQYVENHLRNGYKSSQCIYIDETAINVWMQRKFGRSPTGTKVFHKVCSSRGPKISVVLAISKKGPVHFKATVGSFKRDSYQDFVREVSERLPRTQHYLIHDNASIHNNTLITMPMHKIVQLPPYSPILNPIETFFSQLKSKLRRKLTELSCVEKTTSQEKCQLISKLVGEILAEDSVQNLSNFYGHIKTYYPDCLHKNDIL